MAEENSQDQLGDEKRLRRRLKILQERFEKGQIRFREGLAVKESLLAVRTGPDGEIDLSTVDGLVRSLASAVAGTHDREELKKLSSLSEIQNVYFELVERNFTDLNKIMMETGLPPGDLSRMLIRDSEVIKEATRNLQEFLPVVNEFWENFGEIAHAHVEDMHGNIKGVYGGDFSPAHNENIASKCGIYTDTIILSDPFLRSKHVFECFSEEDQAYYLMKHGLSILQYRQLACSDVEVPIVVILPDRTALQKEEKEFCGRLGQDDALIHSEKLFGRKFESVEDLLEFAKSLDSVEKTLAEIQDASKVLFETDWGENPSAQLQKALEHPDFRYYRLPGGTESPGFMLAMQAIAKLSIANEILVKARRLNGLPIVDVPTSWRYLLWKMKYDASRTEQKTNTHNLHVVRALQELAGGEGEMEWIGNIPTDALIEIRQQGVMDEIREILGNGINDLVNSNPDNFHRSRDKVFDNIRQAFVQHRKNIKELREKQWRFAGKYIGSFLVKGSLEIVVASIGTSVWGLATIAADELLDIPKLRDIPQSIRDLVAENNKIHKSPVGMLFSVSKTKHNA